jgi:hypothetical protein
MDAGEMGRAVVGGGEQGTHQQGAHRELAGTDSNGQGGFCLLRCVATGDDGFDARQGVV